LFFFWGFLELKPTFGCIFLCSPLLSSSRVIPSRLRVRSFPHLPIGSSYLWIRTSPFYSFIQGSWVLLWAFYPPPKKSSEGRLLAVVVLSKYGPTRFHTPTFQNFYLFFFKQTEVFHHTLSILHFRAWNHRISFFQHLAFFLKFQRPFPGSLDSYPYCPPQSRPCLVPLGTHPNNDLVRSWRV